MVDIQIAQASDRLLLEKLEREVANDPENTPYAYDDILARGKFYPWSVTLVATNLAQIRGAISLALKEVHFNNDRHPVGHIFGLRVHPDLQRRGIGRKLVQAAEKLLIKNNAIAAYAYVDQKNRPSQKLFHDNGYRQRGTAAYVDVRNTILSSVILDCENSEESENAAIQDAASHLFCPSDLEEKLYSRSKSSNYLGTFSGPAGGHMSVWDKDNWLARSIPNENSLFAGALNYEGANEWTSIAANILAMFPEKNKLTCILPPKVVKIIGTQNSFKLNRMEDVMVRWWVEPKYSGSMYLDIRD